MAAGRERFAQRHAPASRRDTLERRRIRRGAGNGHDPWCPPCEGPCKQERLGIPLRRQPGALGARLEHHSRVERTLDGGGHGAELEPRVALSRQPPLSDEGAAHDGKGDDVARIEIRRQQDAGATACTTDGRDLGVGGAHGVQQARRAPRVLEALLLDLARDAGPQRRVDHALLAGQPGRKGTRRAEVRERVIAPAALCEAATGRAAQAPAASTGTRGLHVRSR